MEKGNLENLIYIVIGSLIEVHKQLGPGLLESVYHKSFEIELELRGISFESQKEINLDTKVDMQEAIDWIC